MSSRPTAEGAAAPPVFSYAQAAKGRAVNTAASAIQSHTSNTSGISTPAKESTVNTPSGGSEREDRSVNGSYEVASVSDAPVEISNPEPRSATVASTIPEISTVSPSLPNGSASASVKEEQVETEDDFILVRAPDPTRERSTQTTNNSTEKAAEPTEGRRNKKQKKEKKAEKEVEPEKEEVKPEVLVPAAMPAVNFWQQRRELLAQTKPSPIVISNPQPQPEFSSPGESTSKNADAKKRGKAGDDGERSLAAAQNGGTKEATAGKGQKKGGDGQSKVKDDHSSKRSARGNRLGDRDEKSVASQLPPPVEDAISWPTPETALEEEKRKAHLALEKLEKEEKDEGASNKPRQKDKWVTVPFVPTVNFQTQVPTRGGRGRGGARGGRTEPGLRQSQGEKTQSPSAMIGGSSTELEEQSSRDGPRASSLPPTKRQSTDQPSTRKASAILGQEKSKAGLPHNESGTNVDVRKSFTNGHPDQISGSVGHENQLQREQDGKETKSGVAQGGFFENQHARPANFDRHNEHTSRDFSQGKEGGGFSKESNHQPRDQRGDVRSERGRGSYRGRGGNPSFANGQSHPQGVFSNGHGVPTNGYPLRQNSAPYSPPLQQSPFNNQYAPSASRGGRSDGRTRSIPNSAVYGRFPNGGPVSQHMAPIQTSNSWNEYHLQQAVPYAPYGPDNSAVLAMVTMQLEYYFSIDNLCKDVYLRKHMDSQGFVLLTFIAQFKRIQALTDLYHLLRQACHESAIIEFGQGLDGVDRLRRKDGWEKWVLTIEDRDPAANNIGPEGFRSSSSFQQRPEFLPPMFMQGQQHPMSPMTFSPNGATDFRHFENGAQGPSIFNGNGNGSHYHPETPLSAAVPDFSPGLLSIHGTVDPLDAETNFHDDEVAHLTVVFAPPKGSEGEKPKVPFHNASSRTFSNGSIDGRSIAEELHDDSRQGRTLNNGARAPEASPDMRRSRSPFTPKTTTNNSPPIMWVKNQRQPVPLSEHNSSELYSAFRARALRQREISGQDNVHPDMKQLYEFWAHFLCRNFNSTMYSEFRSYALEDAQNKSFSGTNNLISYYDEILINKKRVIPETLAQHYVDLVKSERDMEGLSGRPGFEKLRAAWRNGALDMKSRKKIDNLVDSELRNELEQAPQQKSDS